MTDQNAKHDENRVPTLIGVKATNGEIIRLNADDDGNLIANGPTTSLSRNVAIDETPAVAIKASAGNVYGWNIINPNAYAVYVKFYDALVADTTVGTTAVKATLQIPTSGSAFLKNDGLVYSFATAISVACTKLLVDSDTTAIDTDIYGEIFYK